MSASMRGVQLSLVEDLGEQRGHWVTTVTGMAFGQQNVLWVDVSAEASNVWERSIAAPRVVREILLAGGSPRIGGVPYEVQPIEIDDLSTLQSLLAKLRDPSYSLSVLVVARGSTDEQSLSSQQAIRASDALAGRAQVVTIPMNLIEELDSRVPAQLRIGELRAKLLLAGALTDPENPRRSIGFDSGSVGGSPSLLGLAAARWLGTYAIWPEANDEWIHGKRRLDDLRRNLLREKGGEIASSSSRTSESEIEVLKSRIDDLQNQLSDAHQLTWDWIDEVDRLSAQVITLEDKLVKVLMSSKEQPLPRRSTIAETIDVAQRDAKWIVIPNSARRNIEVLDSVQSARAWAQDLTNLFSAMESYGKEKSTSTFRGNFRAWCQNSGRYSAEKIAMQESETTMANPDLMVTRVFEIDRTIEPSGRKIMVAHVKVQARGSGNIPRVYFHDDTSGRTGKIHIGFIGPHELTPTASF